MASQRNRFRHSLVVNFDNQAAKAAFKTRAEHVRSVLSPAGQPTLDNAGLMSAMFDLVEQLIPAPYAGSPSVVPARQSFNKDSGKLLFVASRCK